jgi:putative transposase
MFPWQIKALKLEALALQYLDGVIADWSLYAFVTYVPMATGFMYLVAVMDWWSRYVLGWRLSNTLEAAFCVDAWEAALRAGRQAPLISNTDQGSQFTSPMFIDAVESAGVDVSMDGRGGGSTTGSSNGCGGAPNMRTSICRITATDWRLVAGWAGGLTAITRSVRIKRWVMRRRRKCTLIPALTEPSQPVGKRCNLKTCKAAKKDLKSDRLRR